MRHIIAQETEKLTKTELIKPHSALFGSAVDDPKGRALTTNADGSRDYDDPIVVLAFVIGEDLMRAHFFYVEENRDHLSAFDMKGAETTVFHSHNFIEFAYVAEGTLRLIINGEVIEFEPGDICLMDRNTEHAEVLGDDLTKLVYISFSSELFESIVDADKAKSHEEQYLRSVLLRKKESYQFVRFRPTADAPERQRRCLPSCAKLRKNVPARVTS